MFKSLLLNSPPGAMDISSHKFSSPYEAEDKSVVQVGKKQQLLQVKLSISSMPHHRLVEASNEPQLLQVDLSKSYKPHPRWLRPSQDLLVHPYPKVGMELDRDTGELGVLLLRLDLLLVWLPENLTWQLPLSLFPICPNLHHAIYLSVSSRLSSIFRLVLGQWLSSRVLSRTT